MRVVKTQNSPTNRYITAQTTIKRNRNLVNLRRINTYQHDKQIKRRTPHDIFEEAPIRQKINTSFMSSAVTLNQKVQKQINKYKTRFTVMSQDSNPQFINSSNISISQKEKPIFSIQKMVSRQYLENLRVKTTNDERQFNNYKQFVSDLKNTKDFDKYLERKDQSRMAQEVDLDSFQLNKIYDKLMYNHISMSCCFNYDTQKQQSQRIYTEKRQNFNYNEIDRSVLQQAQKNCQFRTKHCQFYRYSGRQFPSAFEKNYMKPLNNYYVPYNPKNQQNTLIIAAERIKRQLNEVRLKKKDLKNKIKFTRNQVCTKKYFSLPKQQQA